MSRQTTVVSSAFGPISVNQTGTRQVALPGLSVYENAAVDGNASGDTVTATTSTVDGTATGGASVSGNTVTATVSLIDGTASASSGNVDGNASGDTVVVNASLIAPVFSATGGSIGGMRGRRGPRRIEQPKPRRVISVSASARGATIAAQATLVAGTAVGTAAVRGNVVAITKTIEPGAVNAAAIAKGSIVALTKTIEPGAAKFEYDYALLDNDLLSLAA